MLEREGGGRLNRDEGLFQINIFKEMHTNFPNFTISPLTLLLRIIDQVSITVNYRYSGHSRDCDLVSVLARVHNNGVQLRQTR